MRVLLDTNILISYLLKRETKTITTILEAAFQSRYILLLPHDLVIEFTKKLTEKPYLATHITKKDAQEFIEALSIIAEEVPRIPEPIPQVSRDKKDDYLLAYGVVGEVDYLVSGDTDVRVLPRIGSMKIVSPKEFCEILKR